MAGLGQSPTLAIFKALAFNRCADSFLNIINLRVSESSSGNIVQVKSEWGVIKVRSFRDSGGYSDEVLWRGRAGDGR